VIGPSRLRTARGGVGIGPDDLGDALLLVGAVERFLVSEGLPSKDLGLPRLGSALSAVAGAAQAGSEIAASSGRWVKLTKESAQALKKYQLMKSSEPGVSRAVLTQNGKIKGLLEVTTTPGSLLTSPALLAGAAGLMAQLAMQQTMDEITDYLAAIDEKVDDVLRAQKDAVLADMTGAGFVIEEAMTVREHVGRVSETTWSKVQATSMTIARTQAYALRQLDTLAERMEHTTRIGDLARASRDAASAVREWLAVLARCFPLHDAIAMLELDRVLDASGPASPRTPGCPPEPDGTHLTQHRTPDGPRGCGCRHGQHEGAAAPDRVPGCGAFEQPCRDRRR
jgi:hypothetical protein